MTEPCIEPHFRELSDCQTSIEGRLLHLSGAKRTLRDSSADTSPDLAGADGAFERMTALPCDVEIDKIEASLSNRVLTVRLPMAGMNKPNSLQLS